MASTLKRTVQERAQDRCEYCLIPRVHFPAPFAIEHIIARKHHGKTILSNLAWACLHCNSFKGSNIAGIDAITGEVVRLFHPRRNRWHRHFRCEGAMIVGKTARGRVTVDVLNMNDIYLVALREELIDEGLFP